MTSGGYLSYGMVESQKVYHFPHFVVENLANRTVNWISPSMLSQE
jgi:hypothetical protein